MKRFTETQKWEDPWFRRLRPEIKLLWQWILDRCDNAGVIDPDIDLASFQIGYQYPMDILLEFGERVIKLPCGKWFIPKFIAFQYGQLSTDCKAHKPIFISLEKHGLKGYPKGINTLQEKEKDKEEEKEMEKSGPKPIKARPETSEDGQEFASWFRSLLPESLALPATWKSDFARSYDEMIRIDKRTDDEISEVCQFGTSDSFWSKQLKRPGYLRKISKTVGIQHFDQILDAARAKPEAKQRPTVNLATCKL